MTDFSEVIEYILKYGLIHLASSAKLVKKVDSTFTKNDRKNTNIRK